MEKVKSFPWLYLVIYNHCPFAVYSAAWRCLASIRVLYKEGYDLNLVKVVRYRLERDNSVDVERDVVTDSFLESLFKYES